ncbi:hypothetical protein Bca4012_027186 [Brassica carinata]|uniref:PPM-type phosphatase domain-containing protein n=1 Tax=Brassica carinata TaxID=52824 RepID=A0A8X8AVB8_BRACI|nr:hypothetical protein Bca52824_024179 [Brassica carinata]
MTKDPIRAGEIAVFNVDVHERENTGEVSVIIKGDNNDVDNMGLYADGQFWLHRHHIMGRAVGIFLKEVKSSLRNVFLQADLGLEKEHNISSSSGTTALAPLFWKRIVLCTNCDTIDMSQDRRPIYLAGTRRVEQCGGFVHDGYLNGILSVTRALGDWDIKLPRGDPMRSARDLALEALRLNMFDNPTVVAVCFLLADNMAMAAPPVEKQQCCS